MKYFLSSPKFTFLEMLACSISTGLCINGYYLEGAIVTIFGVALAIIFEQKC